MRVLSLAVGLSLIVLIAAPNGSARKDSPVRLQFAVSDSIPVSIDSALVYKAYSPETEFHTIDFTLTNKSDMYVGQVSLIQYELSEKNEVLTVTVWTERDGLRSYETRPLSANSSSMNEERSRFVWSITGICTDRGTWRVELNALEKAVVSNASGKPSALPAAEYQEAKCTED